MSAALVELDFHSGLVDKLGHACRLARKAWRGGHRVAITGAAAELARLDQLLWTFDPGSFVPHARLRPEELPSPSLARTPIWLVERPLDGPRCTVLINLGPEAVEDLAPWAKVVELVASSDDEVASGRARWRFYKVAGHAPRNHALDADAG